MRNNKIRTKASVEGIHFHAQEFDWSHPDYEVKLDDERWIMDHRIHPIAGHDWHQNLSTEDKIKFGLGMYAHTFLVGAQFERGLNVGATAHGMNLALSDSDRRHSDSMYISHEIGEEVEHTMLFEGLVHHIRKAGVPTTDGAPAWFRKSLPLFAYMGYSQPGALWTGVYAGEAPIDQVQKNIISLHDSGEVEVPKVIEDIVRIHIREEARHIGFVKDYIHNLTGLDDEGNKRMSRTKELGYSAGFAATLATVGKLMTYPDKKARRILNLPDKVAKETYKAEENRQFLLDLYEDPRELAYQIGHLDKRVGRAAWKAFGIHDEAHLSRLRGDS